ncbi:MAG: DUF5989 family protein [Candidatus Omnitrophica bacterium]|nr:DUF5989 family protein [Candidatus Omnitrophota bacterium]
MKIKNWLKRVSLKLSILKEFFVFLWENKLWWMVPMILIFLLLGLLVIFTQSAAVVPFIYALF